MVFYQLIRLAKCKFLHEGLIYIYIFLSHLTYHGVHVAAGQLPENLTTAIKEKRFKAVENKKNNIYIKQELNT